MKSQITSSPSKYDKASRQNFKKNILSALTSKKKKRPTVAKSVKINIVEPASLPPAFDGRHMTAISPSTNQDASHNINFDPINRQNIYTDGKLEEKKVIQRMNSNPDL